MKKRLEQKPIKACKPRWILSFTMVVLLTLNPLFLDTFLLKAQIVSSEQSISVKGTVVDEDLLPLIGVTVTLQGNPTVGTMTDIDGVFTLVVPPNSKLEFSYVGFTSIVKDVNGQDNMQVVMTENAALLDELVVVGYGVQRKVSVTGAVAAVQGKELVSVKTPNVSNMLAGRLPGLRAVQRSGAPGDDNASVDIRGYGSMLVIVDGVERDYTQVNPNDIESVSILKDGAAAVYGFKGANGVLLVTTKQGAKGESKIDYGFYYGWQQNTRYPDWMNSYEYAALYNEAIYNVNPWRGQPAYSNDELARYKAGAGTDWWNGTIRDSAPQSSHNLSISGGTDKVSYFLSAGIMEQEGILKSKDWNYNRYNLRSNVKVEVAKGFDVELRIGGRYDKRKRPFEADKLFASAQQAIPTYSQYANDDPLYWQATGNSPNVIQTSYIDNAGYENRMRREFNSSLTFNWQIPWVEGLMAKAMIAYDYSNKEWKSWGKEAYNYIYDANADFYTPIAIRNNSNLESKQENYYKPTYQYSLNYNRKFAEKHDVGALLLWEMYDDRTTDVMARRFFAIGLVDDMDYGDIENMSNGGRSLETAHAGLVGRLNYAFDNRYLVEFNFRYDGTYKYRAGDRWGFFPGVLAGWRLSEEPFFKDLNTPFDNIKIRGSFAELGDEGNYEAFQYLDGYKYQGSYVMGTGGLTSGMISRGMANPWLTWYKSKISNIGFEASYKQGLLSAEFDWFLRHRTGLPARRTDSLPSTFGETMPEENLNSDINTGFELKIGHRNNIQDFYYDISANFSVTRIKNDYVERSASTNMYDDWRNNTNGRYKDIRWGRKVVGQFQSFEEILNSPIQDGNGNKSLLPGDLKFEDFNGDGIIDLNDEQLIGHGATPRMYYGLNMSGAYKNFDLTLFFQGAAGHDIYVAGDILDTFVQQGLGNGLAVMTDRWHREDPTNPYSNWIAGMMPAARVAGFEDNRSNNSWSLHKADYLRLKTLEVGYTLPKSFLSKWNIDQFRFYVSGNNLLTFTSRDGLMKYVDPESNNSGLRYYPQQKSYNIGANITF